MSPGGTDDAHALHELERVVLGLPPGLEVVWLGVSGYRLTYEGVSLFIDPYVSRVPLRAFLLRRRTLPDEAMIERYAVAPGPVAGVLVGHTHFDHAVDAPAIARRFGTKAYGSPSLAHLMRLHGLGDLAVEAVPHRAYELGPFVVRFVPSRHSKLLFGRKVPMDGPLTCDHLHGLAPGAYKCGAVYGIRIEVAGVSIYHQGSADLNDGELRDGPVDCFWRESPGARSPLDTGSASSRASIRAWSCRLTTTTSSHRSVGPRTSCAASSSRTCPTRSTGSPIARRWPRCRASTLRGRAEARSAAAFALGLERRDRLVDLAEVAQRARGAGGGRRPPDDP